MTSAIGRLHTGWPTLLASLSLLRLRSNSDPEYEVEVNNDEVDELSTSARFPSSLVSSSRNGRGGGGGDKVLDEVNCLLSQKGTEYRFEIQRRLT